MSTVQLARKRINTTTDRISKLPEDVTQQILECLSLQEAARMSILSSHWRHKWSSISKLVIDEGFLSSILKSRTSTVDMSLLYSKIMNGILLSHVGPIFKFVLYLPAWFSKQTDFCQWIRCVRANGIQDFTLVDDRDSEMNVPTSLFSCVTLTHLALKGHKLFYYPPTFRGFPCLISLKIETRSRSPYYSVEASMLENLISKCPQLQSLYLVIFAASLTISAPNIKDLYVGGTILKLCLKGATMLTTLTLDNLFHLFGVISCLTSVKKLVLRKNIWMFTHFNEFPNKFPSELGQLRTLKLEGIPLCYQSSISLALCFLASSPHLEQLYIKASEQEEVSNQASIQIKDPCNLPCLKNVQLLGTSGLIGELQLIKFILAYSPFLEEMTIELGVSMRGDAKTFKFIKEIVQYRRVSANVDVIIKTEKIKRYG